MKKLIVAVLIVLLCVSAILLRSWSNQRDAQVRLAKNDISAIHDAILAYHKEYGVPLDPKSNVFRVLSGGDNLRQILFLSHIDPHTYRNFSLSGVEYRSGGTGGE
jgi:hypothetical protein